MLKLIAGTPPNQILVVGLSFLNLDKFKAMPNDTYIRISENSLSSDVVLYSGNGNRAFGVEQGTGRRVFMVGLEMDDLDQFREKPGKRLISLKNEKYQIGFDIVIFSGETEATMTDELHEIIGPDTKVTVDKRLLQ